MMIHHWKPVSALHQNQKWLPQASTELCSVKESDDLVAVMQCVYEKDWVICASQKQTCRTQLSPVATPSEIKQIGPCCNSWRPCLGSNCMLIPLASALFYSLPVARKESPCTCKSRRDTFFPVDVSLLPEVSLWPISDQKYSKATIHIRPHLVPNKFHRNVPYIRKGAPKLVPRVAPWSFLRRLCKYLKKGRCHWVTYCVNGSLITVLLQHLPQNHLFFGILSNFGFKQCMWYSPMHASHKSILSWWSSFPHTRHPVSSNSSSPLSGVCDILLRNECIRFYNSMN